ncbi:MULTISPECIES: thermostable hemolysin [Vibrio]|uniref:thermostable hemolysin n=1 Tax=Vibrio TaxID=662 RepID=UPI0022AF42F7|nr:thermostable hemolysin [Vibrio sinaloensis]MCZ4295357.1 thermostable hemolysin [Vibrio sinaloensis]
MKPQTQATHFQLDIVYPSHALWKPVVNHVSLRYQQAFRAELKLFMPAYLTLLDNDEIASVCGFRIAADEPLFLEQYLDAPAEVLISNLFQQPVERSNLVEFGHLASFAKGMSPLHFFLIAECLVENGFEWCIFTATDPLFALMSRLGLEPRLIADADAEKILDAPKVWGTYYEHQPKVFAGNLIKGLQRLRLVHNRRKQA